MLFSMTMFTGGIRYCFAGRPTRSLAISYIIHSLASVFRSDSDHNHNVWSISVTLEVLCDISCCKALGCPPLPYS